MLEKTGHLSDNESVWMLAVKARLPSCPAELRMHRQNERLVVHRHKSHRPGLAHPVRCSTD